MSAIISGCGNYRYKLGREVQPSGCVIAYFGINPSTADAEIDDQTVKKWIGFTKRNNGKRFIVGNVFAKRATNVKDLAKCYDPIGPLNAEYIREIVIEADILVPCWGNRAKVPKALWQHFSVLSYILANSGKPVLTFGTTKSGDPKHPMMLGYNTPLIPWNNT